MAFFTSLSASLLAPATESTSTDGVKIYEFKALNQAANPGIPVLLHVEQGTENGTFLKALAENASTTPVKVLVSGVIQSVLAEKDEKTKDITKPPKVIVHVGAARRLRMDTKIEPEQAIIFGSGYSSPITDFEDDTKRKRELFVASGCESLLEEGRYESRLQVIGTDEGGTGDKCETVADGTEVYFMGNLFRSKGEVGTTVYDKLKVSATFMQETDRVKTRKGGGGRKKGNSMRTQLDSSFEETESQAQTLSAEELAVKASVALSDF